MQASPPPDIPRAWGFGLLALAVIAGFLVRMPLPDGLEPVRFYGDEAWYAWDAWRILQGARPVFLEDNNGRQALFSWSMAPVIAAFGTTVFSAKLTAALWGTLAIPFAWLLAREVLHGLAWRTLAAGLVALLTAGLLWHLTASLFAVRAITWPALLLLALWLLLRAWRTGGRGWWLAAGVALAAGLWAYTSAWLVPPLVLAWWLLARGWRRDPWGMPLALLATGVVIAPFLAWAVANPTVLLERPGQVVASGPAEFAANVAAYLAMLVLPGGGDMNPRHTLPGWPALDLLTAALALTGLVLGFRSPALRPAALLALVLAGGLLAPGIVTSEGTPHQFRVIGVLPPVLLLAAIGLQGWLVTLAPRHRLAIAVTAVALVAAGGAAASVLWRTQPATIEAYRSGPASALAGNAAFLAQDPGRPWILLASTPDEVTALRYLAAGAAPGREIRALEVLPAVLDPAEGIPLASTTIAGTLPGGPNPGCAHRGGGVPTATSAALQVRGHARPGLNGILEPTGTTAAGWTVTAPAGTPLTPEIALVAPDGRVLAAARQQPFTASGQPQSGVAGLQFPPVLPRGDYRAGVRFHTPSGLLDMGAVTSGAVVDGFLLPDPTCGPSEALDQAQPVRVTPPAEPAAADGLRVESVALPADVIRPGITLEPILLLARNGIPRTSDWELLLRTDAGAEARASWTPLHGLALRHWPHDRLLRDQPRLDLPDRLPGTTARLLLKAPDGREFLLRELRLDQPGAAATAPASLPR